MEENEKHLYFNYDGELVFLPKRAERVYLFMKNHNNHATTQEFINSFVTTRPSNEVGELRKLGFNIITEMEENQATGTRYGNYILIDKEIQKWK